MKHTVAAFLFINLMILGTNTANAQCSGIVKQGIKKVAPFAYNNQVNNAKIQAGKTATFHLSFFRGVSYKLNICSDESVGKLSYRILDENGAEVYNSAKDNNADIYSFYSNSSQELVVEIKALDQTKSGCVAVVTGMQVPGTANPGRDL
ncbi:MAG: hypothetical protein JST26_07570 [Bacteroidetes bacterium]|nr:hypothetical protein [Bacteroidota bacterium]